MKASKFKESGKAREERMNQPWFQKILIHRRKDYQRETLINQIKASLYADFSLNKALRIKKKRKKIKTKNRVEFP